MFDRIVAPRSTHTLPPVCSRARPGWSKTWGMWWSPRSRPARSSRCFQGCASWPAAMKSMLRPHRVVFPAVLAGLPTTFVYACYSSCVCRLDGTTLKALGAVSAPAAIAKHVAFITGLTVGIARGGDDIVAQMRRNENNAGSS